MHHLQSNCNIVIFAKLHFLFIQIETFNNPLQWKHCQKTFLTTKQWRNIMFLRWFIEKILRSEFENDICRLGCVGKFYLVSKVCWRKLFILDVENIKILTGMKFYFKLQLFPWEHKLNIALLVWMRIKLFYFHLFSHRTLPRDQEIWSSTRWSSSYLLGRAEAFKW